MTQSLKLTEGQSLLDTLSMFHFIGTTERMDESMVALANLLNVSLYEVAHLNAKRPGQVCNT